MAKDVIKNLNRLETTEKMVIKTIFLATAALLSLKIEGITAFTASSAAALKRFHAVSHRTEQALYSNDSFETKPTLNRRDAFVKVTGLVLIPSMFGAILPANADVSDGNALPEGAAQFSRVVRAKTDMIAVAKRVSQSADQMDKTEWNNVGQFLRKVYSVGDDMKAIANGLDPEKKRVAATLIDDLKKYSKAADAPTGTQNGPEFLAYANKITTILDSFLDLLSDVPDEL